MVNVDRRQPRRTERKDVDFFVTGTKVGQHDDHPAMDLMVLSFQQSSGRVGMGILEL